MQITVRELREILIPKLCSLRIGSRECKNPRCTETIDDIQEWLDNLLSIEQSRQGDLHKINLSKDNWTK